MRTGDKGNKRAGDIGNSCFMVDRIGLKDVNREILRGIKGDFVGHETHDWKNLPYPLFSKEGKSGLLGRAKTLML